MAINIATDLKSCIGRLVTAEQNQDVYQGKVVNVIDDIPALVFSKPFKNGCKISNEKYALNLSPTDIVRINDIPAADAPKEVSPPPPKQQQPTAKSASRRNKPEKEVQTKKAEPSKNKKMDELLEKLQKNAKAQKGAGASAKSTADSSAAPLPGPSIQVVCKQEGNEPPKVTILKRGGNLSSLANNLSSSCVISEPATNKKFESKLEMIPPQVLNGKKTQRTVLDQLLANHKQAAVPVRSFSSPHSVSPPTDSQPVQNGTRIDLNLLLSSQNSAPPSSKKQAAVDKKETEHKIFGDFKQFTSKQEPKLQQRPPPVTPKAAVLQKPKEETESDWEEDEADEDVFRPPPPGVVYEEKVENYRNDENVLKDPHRVTSWVKNGGKKNEPIAQPLMEYTAGKQQQQQKGKKKGQSPPAVASHFDQSLNSTGVDEFHSLRIIAKQTVAGDNASRLPVLKAHDKKLLLAAAARLYSEPMYNCFAADRFADFVFHTHKKFKMDFDTMLVIAGANCDTVLLHRFAQFFVNRAVNLIIYDPPAVPGNLLQQTSNIRNVADLPKNPRGIYFLSSVPFHEDEELQRYVLRACRPGGPHNNNGGKQKVYPRLIALDFRLYDVAFMHTLYLGAVDESVFGNGRQRRPSSDSQCFFDARVCDLGIPFQWIQCPKATLSCAFSTSMSSAVKL